ncbi:hypothetical protein MXL15_21375 [Pseudomonas mosselii]|uniref:hypothetical protein n=1 Tax=Pseudomonas mosselii TaxID=78327 RepID=UPI002DBEBA79|nr:hypothetical protein [Pseudomonas mosselii]MEB5934753.1 hypothetical protein [Pseudomonas mosselii]
MILINVYESKNSPHALYELLKKRSAAHSISHNAVPEYAEHELFVQSKPYRYWYLVTLDGMNIGSAYITDNNEIGIFLTDEFSHLQAELLGNMATNHEPLPAVKSKRVGQFSINSNPGNASLISAIISTGGVHVQNSYLLGKSPKPKPE